MQQLRKKSQAYGITIVNERSNQSDIKAQDDNWDRKKDSGGDQRLLCEGPSNGQGPGAGTGPRQLNFDCDLLDCGEQQCKFV